MEKLKAQLDELLNRLENPREVRTKLRELVSIYPFSEYEYIISHLLASHKVSLEEYYSLRNDYLAQLLHNQSLFQGISCNSARFGQLGRTPQRREKEPLQGK